jgi:hypothetical protein
MRRRLALVLILVLPACESPKAEGVERPEPLLPAPTSAELPEGSIVRTSRETDFTSMIEALSRVEFVYVGSAEPAREAELLIATHLNARGRLHAIGVDAFSGRDQAALEEYCFGRIDRGEFVERVGAEPVGRHDDLLAFARKHRLPVVALGVEPALREKVAAGGLDTLSDEERRTLPAILTGTEEHRARWSGGATAGASPHRYEVVCLVEDVMADGVVRWSRKAPADAQMLVLTSADRVAEDHAVPERVRDRIGKRFRSVIVVRAAALERAAHSEEHAHFVWAIRPAE